MEVKLPHRSPPVTSTNRVASDANPEQIWDEFRNGSELAFTALYKKYVADLYHYGERLTDDKQLIEDSIHDLFVELWRQRASYKPVLRLKFYLLKSFRNRLMKNLYKERTSGSKELWRPVRYRNAASRRQPERRTRHITRRTATPPTAYRRPFSARKAGYTTQVL